jgi:hypothetical protein
MREASDFRGLCGRGRSDPFQELEGDGELPALHMQESGVVEGVFA